MTNLPRRGVFHIYHSETPQVVLLLPFPYVAGTYLRKSSGQMRCRMKVYLSGPMSGYVDFNRPYFNATAKWLRREGYEVLNPAEVDLRESATWADYMRHDIKMLMDADAIYMQTGWEESRGATIEKELADKLGIPTLEL